MAFKYIIGDTETDKATEATLPDGGSYNHTVALGTAGNATWLHITPGDPSPYVDFFGTYNSTSNPTHNDNVFHLGHNVNPGGGPVISGRGVLSDAWESYYNGGHVQQERHLKWVDADGYETRFISFEGHLDVGSTNLFIDSTTIRLGSGRNANTPPSVSVAPTITVISSPDGYNVALFDQDASGYVHIAAGNSTVGQDRAALHLSSSGQASITTRFVGTIQDATALQPQYYWDAYNTILQSPDSTSAKIVMSGGSGPILYANSIAALLVQYNQIFINNRLLYIQRDGVGTSQRGDLWGSYLARNTTAATAIATQQFSPPIVQTGYGWTGSINRAVSFQTQSQPDGTGGGKLSWGYTNDEANYSEIASLDYTGILSASSFKGTALDTSTATALTIGGTTATSVTIGNISNAYMRTTLAGAAETRTTTTGIIGYSTSAAGQFLWGSNYTRMYSQDGNGQLLLTDDPTAQFWMNGAMKLNIAPGEVSTRNGTLLRLYWPNIGTNERLDQASGIMLDSQTNADSGTPQQYSPGIFFHANAWTGSVAQPTDFMMQVRNTAGATPTARLAFSYSVDAVNGTEIASLTNTGLWNVNNIDVDGYINLAATVGTWTQGPNLNGVNATNSNFIKYTPNDAGTTPWYQWAGSFANGGGRRNQVMRFGWNVDGGGGRVVTGANNGVLASEYEQYFEGGHDQMERHETFVDTDGYQTRWLSFEGHLDDGTTTLYQYASTIQIGSGRNSSDSARYVLTPTNTRVYSPNNFNYLWAEDGMMWLQAGTDATAKSKITFDPAGDLTLTTKRGFLQDGYSELLMQWQALGGPGTGAIWLRSPDDSAEVFVNNGGLQLIAGGILGIRHTGTALTLNNGTAGITMQRSSVRSFQFGDASNATKIYGPDDNAYLSLASGVTGAQLVDVNEKITAATAAGIIFTTNNVERARFDYSAFRPSTNGTFKNGDNGARWSETWTVDLYASGTSNVGNVIPITNDAYSLGTSSNKWHDGYFNGTISVGTGITIANASSTITASVVNSGVFQGNSLQRYSGGDATIYTSAASYTVHVGNTGVTLSLESDSVVFDNNTSPNTITIDGYTVNPTDNAISLGDATHNWIDSYITNSHSSWFDTKMGTQLTAASTITPTSGLHHVTGATTIDTIATTNVPPSSTVELTLIADGGTITLGTTNIKVGGTIAIDTAQKLVWDGSFWYLVA